MHAAAERREAPAAAELLAMARRAAAARPSAPGVPAPAARASMQARSALPCPIATGAMVRRSWTALAAWWGIGVRTVSIPVVVHRARRARVPPACSARPTACVCQRRTAAKVAPSERTPAPVNELAPTITAISSSAPRRRTARRSAIVWSTAFCSMAVPSLEGPAAGAARSASVAASVRDGGIIE